MVLEDLRAIPNASVRTFLFDDVDEIVVSLGPDLASSEATLRVAACVFPTLTGLHDLLQASVEALAKIALSLWPEWYGRDLGVSSDVPGDLDTYLDDDAAIRRLAFARREISRPWLRAATTACQKGKLPLPEGYPRSIHAAQLALAVEPRELIVVLGLTARDSDPDALLGLAKTAEWLAKETGAKVAVMLSATLTNAPGLETILYGAKRIPRRSELSVVRRQQPVPDLWVWPFLGRPHPFSPGEQQLARALAADAELAGLFCFNTPVETVRHSRYVADLLWVQGKMVVEVDGYRTHYGVDSFYRDRHRDYELVISGYTVIRITHDEIAQDLALAIDKIRDVVRFLTQKMDS